MRGWAFVIVAALAAGCNTLTPAQNRSLDEVRVFADDAARVYALHPIHVLVSHNPESPVGTYRRGFFAVNELVLRSEFRTRSWPTSWPTTSWATMPPWPAPRPTPARPSLSSPSPTPT